MRPRDPLPVVLFALAAALRLLHLWTIRDAPFFTHLFIDPGWYDEWGLRIAQGEWLADQPFFLDPLYPYFIGVVYAVFGHSYTVLGVVQALLGAAVAPLVYLAGREHFPRPVPALAGAIAVGYLPAIYFGAIVMKPGLSLVLVSLGLWLLSRAWSVDRPREALAAGAVLALAALTRGNLVLLLPVVALFVARSVSLAHAGRLLAGAAIVLVFPVLHNFRASGELILTTSNAGQNFYIGNNAGNETGEYIQLPFVNPNPKYEQRDFRAEAERRAGRTLSDREISRFWFGEAGEDIRADPAGWVVLLWRKLRSFWGAYEIPDSLDYALYAKHAPVLGLPLPGFGLLAPLGLLGAALSARRRGWPRLLIVFSAAYCATVVLFFVFSRFRVVLYPILYLFAAWAVVWLVHAITRREWRRLAGGAAALLALWAFVNLPVRANPDHLGYRLAGAIGLPTHLETSAAGHFNIGVTYAGLAKQAEGEREARLWLDRAEVSLRASVEAVDREIEADAVRLGLSVEEAGLRHPRARLSYEELGKVLARGGKNREAIELYSRAVAVNPGSYRLSHGLGLLYLRLGDRERAARAFAEAWAKSGRRYAPSAEKLAELGYAD